jgi:hypothetical protein
MADRLTIELSVVSGELIKCLGGIRAAFVLSTEDKLLSDEEMRSRFGFRGETDYTAQGYAYHVDRPLAINDYNVVISTGYAGYSYEYHLHSASILGSKDCLGETARAIAEWVSDNQTAIAAIEAGTEQK